MFSLEHTKTIFYNSANLSVEKNYFSDVPNEIIKHIFSFLDTGTFISTCSLVCRKWRIFTFDRALLNKIFWNHLEIPLSVWNQQTDIEQYTYLALTLSSFARIGEAYDVCKKLEKRDLEFAAAAYFRLFQDALAQGNTEAAEKCQQHASRCHTKFGDIAISHLIMDKIYKPDFVENSQQLIQSSFQLRERDLKQANICLTAIAKRFAQLGMASEAISCGNLTNLHLFDLPYFTEIGGQAVSFHEYKQHITNTILSDSIKKIT